ncbi:MAG: hypothetical protein HY816_22445 [Candidatus Wallbacteria bacterium]|nr:hypothetical protein [Candidatus Wallbacteria bacterium]
MTASQDSPGAGVLEHAARTMLDPRPVGWRFLALVALLLVAAAALPCAVGYVRAAPGETFLGFVDDWPDVLMYFSFAERAMRGEIVTTVPCGTPDQRPRILSGLSVAMGWVATATGMEPPTAHLATRLLAAAVLVPVLALFFRGMLGNGAPLRFAVLSVALGSGLGWVVGPVETSGWNPTDRWHIGTVALYAASTLAHLTTSWCLLLLSYHWLGCAVRTGSRRFAAAGGAAICVNGLLHPYHFVSASVAAFALTAWRAREAGWRRPGGVLLTFLATGCPAFLGQAWLTYSQPVMRHVVEQSMNLSPHPLEYVLGFGVAGMLAAGALLDRRRIPGRQRVAVVWIVVCGALLYSYRTPLGLRFERRFADVLVVPLMALGTRFLFGRVLPAIEAARGRTAAGLVVALLLVAQIPSNVLLVQRLCEKVNLGLRPYSTPTPEVHASRALRTLATDGDTVLSHVPASLVIPALSGTATVLSHPHWRPGHHRLQKRAVAEYWGEPSASARAAFLREVGATMVYIGQVERELLKFAPASDPSMIPIYEKDGVSIYRIHAPPR